MVIFNSYHNPLAAIDGHNWASFIVSSRNSCCNRWPCLLAHLKYLKKYSTVGFMVICEGGFFWWFDGDFILILWVFYGDFMVVILGWFLVDTWWCYGDFVNLWWFYGNLMVNLGWFYSDCMVIVLWLYRGFMVFFRVISWNAMQILWVVMGQNCHSTHQICYFRYFSIL